MSKVVMKRKTLIGMALAALAMSVVSCGNNEESVDAARDIPEATSIAPASTGLPALSPTPTTIPPPTTQPEEAPQTSSAPVVAGEAMEVLRTYIELFEAGDHEGFTALMTPDLYNSPFLGMTRAQFATFNSHFGFVPNQSTECELTETGAQCAWRGQDDLARAMGYELQVDFAAVVVDGLITDLTYTSNEGAVFAGLAGFMGDDARCAPEDPAWVAAIEAGELEMPDGTVFGSGCSRAFVENASAYAESEGYVPPPERD